MASKGRLMREICFGSKMVGEESAGGHELFKDNHTGTTYHISREKNQVLLAVPLLASSLKKNQNELKKKKHVLFLIDVIELCSSAWRSLRRGKFKTK